MAVLATQHKSKLAFEVTTDRHKMLSDVSVQMGGEDLGPDPHAMLEAALAACTAITLEMYATRKGMLLENCDVKIKILEEGPKNRIERRLQLSGSLTQDQRDSLTAIANKCPIHKLLTAGAEILTITEPAP